MSVAKKLKIAFVFDDSLDRNDGVQQYVKTLGGWFSAQGHNVVYFVGETKLNNWKNGKIYSLARNAKVKFNANRLSIPLPASKKNIASVLDSEKPDILHVQVPYSPYMSQKVIDSAGLDTVVVGTFHILPAGKLQKFGSKMLKTYYGNKLERFDKFFAVSEPAKQFAKQVFKIESQVLPNVVDIKIFKNSEAHKSNRIVFLGRLVERKGCEHLIRAVAILKKDISDFELIVASDGPDRNKLERLCEELDIKQNVKFIGYIDEGEKPGLLGSAAVACFPSLYGESFGIVLIEAMASGSGVVLGGNNPGYSSVLSPKPELLFDPINHDELAKKLRHYLTDKKSAQDINIWQQNYVERFDVARVGKQLLDEYSLLVENKSDK